MSGIMQMIGRARFAQTLYELMDELQSVAQGRVQVGLPQETKNVISETQDLVAEGFKVEDRPLRFQPTQPAIKRLADTPDETIKTVLGKTGLYLKRFAVRVNVEHPDLDQFLNLFGWKASTIFNEACRLLDETKENAESSFLGLNDNYSQLVRALQHPPSRLLAGIEDRKEQRQEKNEILMVGLKTAFSAGEDSFFARPDNFKRFARNSTFYQAELKELMDRTNLFRTKGMVEMSNAYAQQMRKLEESISPLSGFHRITPSEAAIISARLHGFKWSGANSITVPSKLFEGCRFWGAASETNQEESLKKTLILNTRFVPGVENLVFNYQPRYYPLHCFTMPMPESVQRIIDKVEHFSLLGDNPFFDSYWLLVPSININHPAIQKGDSWTLFENGSPVTYNDPRQAALALDAMLVKSGCVVPVLLGDRDCKCFFLSQFC